MKYREEIDGLRAVAVTAVILYHAQLNIMSGGFLGVDVFFVISGYLITNIILEEKIENKFSIVHFYERRARRILPALLNLLILASIISYKIMLPSQLKEYGQSLISAILFSANIFFWMKTDYWAQSAELTPLLHIWSLGVEEQFYFIFPLFIIALVSDKMRYSIIFIIISSFGLMLYFRSVGDIAGAFYLLPCRAWELTMGASSAIFAENLTLNQYKCRILNILSLSALISALIWFDSNTNPAILFGVPVLSTFLLISFMSKDGLANKILTNKALVATGLISYSLYLFHQPILALSRIYSFGQIDVYQTVICILATIILSILSYYLIEKPAKNRDKVKTKNFTVYCILVSFSLLMYGIILHVTLGFREHKITLMNSEAKSVFLKFEEVKKSRAYIWEKYLKDSSTNFERDDKIKVLFIGDSLSEDLLVASSMSKDLLSIAQIKRFDFDDECFKNIKTNGNEIGHDLGQCTEEKTKLLDSDLLKNSQYIVIAAAWLNNAKYLSDFLNLNQVKNKKIIIYQTHSFMDMTSLLLYLDKIGMSNNSKHFSNFVYLNRHQRTISANNLLYAIAKEKGFPVINGFDFFCDFNSQGCDVIDIKGYPMLVDQTHLSGVGVVRFSEWFAVRLRSLLLK